MSTDINTEMTTPSTTQSGGSTPHYPPHPDPQHGLEAPRRIPPGIWLAVAVVVVLLLAAIVYGLLSRASDERHLEKVTTASAIPTVNVTHPEILGMSSEIALPGDTQAYNDTPIYARTNGYLKQWFVDIEIGRAHV